jgi:hypothetical protein
MVGEINDSQRKMPFEGICGDMMIIEWLEDGYTAEERPYTVKVEE